MIGVDIRKKRKSGKDNRVCGESKNDSGRSRSSIEKSIREDEMTSKQRKKRNRSMEKER